MELSDEVLSDLDKVQESFFQFSKKSPMIAVKNVTKVYSDNFAAPSNISLDIKRGEILLCLALMEQVRLHYIMYM